MSPVTSFSDAPEKIFCFRALADIVVIDARSRDAYIAGHIPGGISFPHRDMNAETIARFDRSKVYVVCCDGIGCNAST